MSVVAGNICVVILTQQRVLSAGMVVCINPNFPWSHVNDIERECRRRATTTRRSNISEHNVGLILWNDAHYYGNVHLMRLLNLFYEILGWGGDNAFSLKYMVVLVLLHGSLLVVTYNYGNYK